jgi:hypothetical protein
MTANRRVRVYFWSRLQHARFVRLSHGVFIGAWLGLLSPSDLDDVDDLYYVGASAKQVGPIDYTSAEYNKLGFFEWEQRVIDAHFAPFGSLALMAAGGGREVLALRRSSWQVDAWDCQPAFVAAANALLVAEGFEPCVSFAPRNAVPDGAERYDGVIIGWGAYSLIARRERRVEVLHALRAKVEPGAPLLVSFLTRHSREVDYRITARVGNVVRRAMRRRPLEVGDTLEPNFVHRFDEHEMRDELAAGGFVMQSYAHAPYGHAVALAADG